MEAPAAGRPARAARVASLVALTAIAYVPALHGGFVWGDDFHVTHNQLLRSWEGLWAIWFRPGAMLQYYPLTHTSLWLEWRLWGLGPGGYHAVNVVLHAANASLLWLVLRRLAVPGAWVAAAVFALHPVHVESVAWITELKNVQSGFFYLLAGLAYLHRALPTPGQAPGRRWHLLALGSYVCALLSKTVTCTLPLSLLLCLWWKRGRLGAGEVRPLVALLAVGVAAGAATMLMERHLVGAQGEDWALSAVDRCLVAGRAFWFYLGKLAFPADLSFVYRRWHIDAGAWSQYLFPLAAAGVAALLWALRARIGRGPLAALLHYTVAIGPALGFIDVYPMRYSFVADHYAYLASTGPLALATGAATLAARRLRRPPIGRRVAVAAAAAMLLALGAATWRRGRVYAGPEALWRDTIAKNPDAWMAHNNLGLVLLRRGELGGAAAHFRRALALRPGYFEALYNLGNVAAAEGRWDEAGSWYERTLAVAPAFAPAHNNLGNVLVYQGRPAEGVRHYERALELLPDYPDARRNLEIARRAAGGR